MDEITKLATARLNTHTSHPTGVNDRMQVTMTWRRHRAEVHLHGKYDPADAACSLAEISRLLRIRPASVVMVDITGVEPFAGPDCLRALLRLRAQLGAIGAELIVTRHLTASEPGTNRAPSMLRRRPHVI